MVLLIYPCKDNPLSSPPLGILHLKAMLSQSNIPSEVCCTSYGFSENNSVEDITLKIKEDTICCGFSVMTGPQIIEALELSSQIRKKYPNVVIIWGGIHPTLAPEQTIENENIDIVCVGEFEKKIVSLVRCIEEKGDLSTVPSIYYKINNEIHSTKAGSEVFDLNELPLLPFDSFPLDKFRKPYLDPFYKFRTNKVATIEITRGCPLSCYFCVQNKLKTKFRYMNKDRMIEHLRHLKDLGFEAIAIADDNFFINPKANEYLEAIAELNLNMEIYVSIPVTILYAMNEDDIDLIQKAGIRTIGVSVESGSDRMLNIMGKKHKIDMAYELNRKLRNRRIVLNYNFIAGFPEETIYDIKQTYVAMINLILGNIMTQVNIKRLMPTPNTAVYRACIEKGMPAPKSLSDWVSYVDLEWKGTHSYIDPEVENWYKELKEFHETLFWFCYFHNTKQEMDDIATQKARLNFLMETIKRKVQYPKI